MKKIALTIAIVLGITIGAMAQQGGGLFGKGASFDAEEEYTTREGGMLSLPGTHGSDQDQDSPLGGGALLLIGFGAAYALKKKNGK